MTILENKTSAVTGASRGIGRATAAAVVSEYAVWTYEKPYEAMASIQEHLAFILHASMHSR
jgi:NAD(P)-dependent dehydrogenase (short-subunit alcohol dehydrogenase family)